MSTIFNRISIPIWRRPTEFFSLLLPTLRQKLSLLRLAVVVAYFPCLPSTSITILASSRSASRLRLQEPQSIRSATPVDPSTLSTASSSSSTLTSVLPFLPAFLPAFLPVTPSFPSPSSVSVDFAFFGVAFFGVAFAFLLGVDLSTPPAGALEPEAILDRLSEFQRARREVPFL